MTEHAQNPSIAVTLEGVTYRIVPTAFRSHFQLVSDDGKLLGLLELVDATAEDSRFLARPASGTGMTQALMLKIADAAFDAGLFG
jgi:hypothetical protein